MKECMLFLTSYIVEVVTHSSDVSTSQHGAQNVKTHHRTTQKTMSNYDLFGLHVIFL